MRKSLWAIEKFAICFRSSMDVKNGLISSVKPRGEIESQVVSSPFIASELVKMTMGLRNVYSGHWVVMKIFADKTNAPPKIMRACEALSLLCNKICELQLEIDNVNASAEVERKLVLAKREVAEGENAYHLVLACDNELIALKGRAESKLVEKYKELEVFLYEKIRVLNECILRQENIQSRHILRIQYYYDYACQLERRLRPISFNVTDFGSKIDLSCVQKNREELEKTQQLLDMILGVEQMVEPEENIQEAEETASEEFAESPEEKNAEGVSEDSKENIQEPFDEAIEEFNKTSVENFAEECAEEFEDKLTDGVGASNEALVENDTE